VHRLRVTLAFDAASGPATRRSPRTSPALDGYGRAFAATDPARALRAWSEGLAYAKEQRLPFFEATMARDFAGLEAVHGGLEEALSLFDTAIDTFERVGNVAVLAETLASLAAVFDRSALCDAPRCWVPRPRGPRRHDHRRLGATRRQAPLSIVATPVRYTSLDEDSGRWRGFEHRAGDIVISTRSKHGTTWVRMICALLVFQTPDLPAPLGELSPWLDWARGAARGGLRPARVAAPPPHHQDPHTARRAPA
jgi:hypothetical protein